MNFNLGPRIGIMGGGQLALMLSEAAFRMGLRPLILAESSESPAAQICPDSLFGSEKDETVLDCLFSQASSVIFENEFIDCERLRQVGARWKTRFYPGLDTIAQLQDKLKQKELLVRLGIPTAAFVALRTDSNPEMEINSALNKFGGSCVLKWSRLGYDGKGVLRVSSSGTENSKVEIFLSEARKRRSPLYAEQKIDFKRELALVATRSISGEFVAYPLVVSEQKNGICHRVFGPATEFGLEPEKEKQAVLYAKLLAEEVEFVGTFALEFFETSQGELLVNEIAPRVHNSGHYTQDACLTDQFENHLRAVLGLPLGEVRSRKAFVMLNFLGPEFEVFKESFSVSPEPGPRTQLHWYHKREIRPGRKVGHLNGVVDSIGEMDSLFNEMNECHQRWIEKLTVKRRTTS